MSCEGYSWTAIESKLRTAVPLKLASQIPAALSQAIAEVNVAMRELQVPATLTGTFSGNFMIVVTNGKFDPNASCDSGCDTTAGFVATVYGPAATFDIPSFGFTYHANGPDLIQREWHDASADQGGNGGDIRSS